MDSRTLSNWLDGYLELLSETEPARAFQKWVGLSAIAAALRKKVSLSLGRIRIYPNLYVVLVAEPGVARKTQAINYGLDLLSNIPDIVMSADATTKEALLQDMEECQAKEPMPDGDVFVHSSINVVSRELESFLGQKKENTKMLVLLTDLFDCQELPWKYRTKNSGSNTLPSLFLNFLAATTPDSLASCFPVSAIGAGLTSRIMFIWADKKWKKVTRPKMTPYEIKLKESLIKDLYLISIMSGEMEFTPEAYELWDKWYQNYEEADPDRVCKDPSFNGWYSRKPTYVLKLSLVLSAAQSSKMLVKWEHFEQAFKLVEDVERDMGNVFKSIGKSVVTAEVDMVTQIIKAHGWIREKILLAMVWRDIDAMKFDNVIQTVIRKGSAKRTFKGPKGEVGDIWYVDSKLIK